LRKRSTAEDAGIRGPRQVVIVGNIQLGVGGDLIVAVDGKPVMRDDDLQRALNHKHAGDNMQLTINRGGKVQKINVKLGTAPETI
jgi:S1-C subfamily serine protease